MTTPIYITGPDSDGLLWICTNAGGLQGAVSVRADSIAGRAFAASRSSSGLRERGGDPAARTATPDPRTYDVGPGFVRAKECPDCGHTRCGEDCNCNCDAARAEHEAAYLRAEVERLRAARSPRTDEREREAALHAHGMGQEDGFREGLRQAAARIPFLYDGSASSYENVALLQKGILALESRLASSSPSAPPSGDDARAPWYLADGSTVMLPADEVERRRKLAAKVIAAAQTIKEEAWDGDCAPGGSAWWGINDDPFQTLANALEALDASSTTGGGTAGNEGEKP